MPHLVYILTALAAYLLGSIPFGFIAAKVKGIDIRTVGSGNIGATNAMRVLGKPIGITVLLLDAAKGFVAVKFIPPLIWDWGAPHDSGLFLYFHELSVEHQMKFFVLAGVLAVLGHNYTCWLKFKGGKGIATTAGVYLALAPWALLVALVIFILAIVFTKYVSVGSILGAIALPTTVWVMSPNNLLLGIVTTGLGALAIYKHKSNIQRLMAGTENPLGQKKETK